MTKLSVQPYKGTRDFYPEDKRLQKWMFSKWQNVCEGFGYEEYDAPILEMLELYTAKTSEEIVSEQTYSFTDRGGRQVVMRPEMTPSVSRMVAARRKSLSYPLRLYSIPNCFRYERPQRGRLREFWQLNADIFGIEGVEADIEVIELSDSIMKAFGAQPNQYQIRINSRKLLKEIEAIVQLPQDNAAGFYRLIDTKEKIDVDEFWQKMTGIVPGDDYRELLNGYFSARSIADLPHELVLTQSAKNVAFVIEQLNQRGVSAIFGPEIVRGFDYYTDIVFEVFDMNPENNRAMFGGGRYDGLVGEFGVEPIATVGFGMGDATLFNFLESNELLPQLPSGTDVYIVVLNQQQRAAADVARVLRSKKLNVSVDLSNKKMDKQLKTANKKGARFAVFVGDKEVDSEIYEVKDLQSGVQVKCGLDAIYDTVR
jgi:histidyl-tRNA synthetase